MKMIIPWYETDAVPIEYVSQIPGVTGIATSLNHIPAGEEWPRESIDRLRKMVKAQNLELEVIDYLPVHGRILERKGDYVKELDSLKQTIQNLGEAGIRCISYRFSFAYTERFPFRHDKDRMFQNLEWFLNQIIPLAAEYDVYMALHPQMLLEEKEIDQFLSLVDDPHNGITLCCSSIASHPQLNFPGYVRKYLGMHRVPYAHINNLILRQDGTAVPCAHYSDCGSLDMMQVVKSFHDSRYQGYLSPDRGRVIWHRDNPGESGFYDRALGILYVEGIWETLDKIDWED